MSHDEIVTKLRGNSSDGFMTGSGTYGEYYAPNGEIRSKNGLVGRWRVNKYRFCAAYEALGGESCYFVDERQNGTVAWVPSEGSGDQDPVGYGRIVPGNYVGF
jgi:hypothetical protein